MTRWGAEMLMATTVLMALVLLLRRPVARYFGARAAYALWLAPLLRFLFPSFAQPIEAPGLWIDSGATAASTIAPVSAAVPLGEIVLALWIGGAVLFLAIHAIAYRRFVVTALAGATPLIEAGIDDAAILVSGAVTGPAASGLLIRRIFVPRDFATTFSPVERRLALSHEALHHRRGDLWASAAALLCLALHWFNPLAHIAHRSLSSRPRSGVRCRPSPSRRRVNAPDLCPHHPALRCTPGAPPDLRPDQPRRTERKDNDDVP